MIDHRSLAQEQVGRGVWFVYDAGNKVRRWENACRNERQHSGSRMVGMAQASSGSCPACNGGATASGPTCPMHSLSFSLFHSLFSLSLALSLSRSLSLSLPLSLWLCVSVCLSHSLSECECHTARTGINKKHKSQNNIFL